MTGSGPAQGCLEECPIGRATPFSRGHTRWAGLLNLLPCWLWWSGPQLSPSRSAPTTQGLGVDAGPLPSRDRIRATGSFDNEHRLLWATPLRRCLSPSWGVHHNGHRQATAPLSAGPATASGTFNPLCKVLCILQSLYLCSIGPMSVFCLATDTHCTSNCSPKPLYSWMPAASTLATAAQRWVYRTVSLCGRPFQGLPWCNGSQWHCCLLHSPQHQLRSTKAVRKRATALLGLRCPGCNGIPFGMSQVLPVHSPLLRQSRLLAVPPLSDMLKFGGSFSVSQVTFLEPHLEGPPQGPWSPACHTVPHWSLPCCLFPWLLPLVIGPRMSPVEVPGGCARRPCRQNQGHTSTKHSIMGHSWETSMESHGGCLLPFTGAQR